VGQAKDLQKHFKSGDWNKYRLEARGNTFTVWLNGTQAAKYTDAKYAEAAPIGLQIHPGLAMKVEFRNIRLQALD
jgi:glycyl-tRNA synthetase alpha subunit